MTETNSVAKITPVTLAHAHHEGPAEVESLNSSVRYKIWIGLGLLLLFFGFGGGWAALAPLSGAVVASGVVSAEGRNRTVQHLEGGIIEKLLVQEGKKVKKGETLVILSDIASRAEVNTLSIQLIHLATREARLKAEILGKRSISFDHPALQDRGDYQIRSAIAQQEAHFATRVDLINGRDKLMDAKIAQLKEQIEGLKIQMVSVKKQLKLSDDERIIVAQMVEKGYERKPRLLGLQSRAAELIGQTGRILSDVARIKEQISEALVQKEAWAALEREKVEKEIDEIMEQRKKTEAQIRENLDKLARTRITAPETGTVINLRYQTTGGIIAPGRAILDIVPDNDQLVIEARVSPKDIDDVREGQPAHIIFPSYPQRNLKRIDGMVDLVSADTIIDEQNSDKSKPYYLARVRVDMKQLREIAPEIKLGPGLPAEAFIQTVERTVLDYLLQPVTLVLEKAFKER